MSTVQLDEPWTPTVPIRPHGDMAEMLAIGRMSYTLSREMESLGEVMTRNRFYMEQIRHSLQFLYKLQEEVHELKEKHKTYIQDSNTAV